MAINNHVYVSSVHGTNTGGSDTSFATQQTGAMSSIASGSVYINLGYAIAGCDPTDGQVIYVADDHDASYDNGGHVIFNETSTLAGVGLLVVSVDAANVDAYSPGATENLTDTADDYVFESNLMIAGMDLETGDDILRSGWGGTYLRLQDCILRPSGNSDIAVGAYHDGMMIDLINVDILGNTSNSIAFKLSNGCYIRMRGGSINGGISKFTDFSPGTNGGVHMSLDGVDLSAYTGGLLQPVGGNSTDNISYKFRNCKLNAAVTLNGDIEYMFQRLELHGCDDGTGNELHRFYITDVSGTAKNNDATYVTATDPWFEGSSKSSIEVTTLSTCSSLLPFTFKLPAQYVDLSQAASNVLTLDLVSNLSLTDTDIAAFLIYPDGTVATQANLITSGQTAGAGNIGVDPIGNGTALATSALGAGDWTGEPASPFFYEMELDTSVDAGQASGLTVRIEVYKASIDGTTNKLFIHPLLTLS
jgi:hypothetical protein